MFAFSGTMWQQSLSCEVYSLACLLLALLLYVAHLWYDRPDDTRLLQGLAFLYGVALTDHVTLALFLPGFMVLVFTRRKTLIREGRVLASLIGAFFLPLTLYAYLPLTARWSGAPITWGDPTTPLAFYRHITGAQYQHFILEHPELIPSDLRGFGARLVDELGALTLLLSLAGLWVSLRSPARRPFGLLFVSMLVVNIAFGVCYSVFDAYVYFIPSYLVLAALLTVGADAVVSAMGRSLRWTDDRRERAARLAIPVVLGVAVVQISTHYAANDESGNYLEADFAHNLLASAPPQAVLIAKGNTAFSLWYWVFVRHYRTDVTVVSAELFGNLAHQESWYARHLARYDRDLRAALSSVPDRQAVPPATLMARSIERVLQRGRAVLFAGDGPFELTSGPPPATSAARLDYFLAQTFDEAPWGLGYRLYPKGSAPDARTLLAQTTPLWTAFRTRGLYDGWAQSDPLQEHLILRYARAGVAFGRVAEAAGRFDQADAAYAQASRLYHISEADAGRARCARRLASRAN
jgi:hypothetical protein